MSDKKFILSNYQPHQQNDVLTRNENIDKGKTLCKRCEGTGNELFSMYRKCTDCNGTGIVPELPKENGK